MFTEFMCLRFVAFPKIQILKCNKLFGCIPVSFRTWWMVTTVLSVCAYTEFVTLGAFTGTMWHTVASCDYGKNEVLTEWENIWDHSILGHTPPFVLTILICWALKFIQLGFALVDALPVTSEVHRIDYEVCTDTERQYVTTYPTLTHLADDEFQNHGAALMALAQANGMLTVFCDDLSYALRKAHLSWARQEQGYFEKTWDHARSQLNRGIQCGVTGILCKGLQLNLKITTFRLLRSMQGEWSNFAIVCITTAGVNNALALFQLYKYVMRSYDMLRVMREAPLDDTLFRHSNSGVSMNGVEGQKAIIVRKFKCKLMVLVIFFVLYAMVFGYAVFKLFADMLFCSGVSVWNLTGCSPQFHSS